MKTQNKKYCFYKGEEVQDDETKLVDYVLNELQDPNKRYTCLANPYKPHGVILHDKLKSAIPDTGHLIYMVFWEEKFGDRPHYTGMTAHTEKTSADKGLRNRIGRMFSQVRLHDELTKMKRFTPEQVWENGSYQEHSGAKKLFPFMLDEGIYTVPDKNLLHKNPDPIKFALVINPEKMSLFWAQQKVSVMRFEKMEHWANKLMQKVYNPLGNLTDQEVYKKLEKAVIIKSGSITNSENHKMFNVKAIKLSLKK